MRARRVTSLSDYADPAATGWQDVAPEEVEMVPAPLGLQPTEHIRVMWEDRAYGELDAVNVRAVHDGTSIAVHLNWAAQKPGTGAGEGFPDGAAIAFPVRGEPILMQMGSADAPMQFVQWQASKKQARSVLAKGIGSTVPGAPVDEAANASWSAGRWSLVLSRTLAGDGDSARIEAGKDTQIGFAVWNGSNEERAGIKAVSPDWTALSIEA